jgi:hypothetical protein
MHKCIKIINIFTLIHSLYRRRHIAIQERSFTSDHKAQSNDLHYRLSYIIGFYIIISIIFDNR